MRKLLLSSTVAFFAPLFITARAQVCFTPEPPHYYQTGTNRNDVKAADMDGDGEPDLIATNYFGQSITVFRNTGATFPDGLPQFAEVNAPVGNTPFRLFIADFDNDGSNDIAVTNQGDGTVSVLLNDGAIGLTLMTYAVGTSPMGITGGDFNGDGFTDIVTANRTAKTLSILYNTGNGTFHPAVSVLTGGLTPIDLAAGEFDGMPGLDLVVGFTPSPAYCFATNNGNGTLTALEAVFIPGVETTSSINSPMSVDTADFNNDGRADVVFNFPINKNQQFVTLKAPSTGSGANWPQGPNISLNTANGPIGYDMTCADFNGDGNVDIAVTIGGAQTDTIKILLGDGAMGVGAYKSLRGYHNSDPRGIVAVDFNHDGKPDLATANMAATSGFYDRYAWLNTTPYFTVTGNLDTCGPTPQTVVLTATSAENLTYSWAADQATGIGDTFSLTANAPNNRFSVSGNDLFGCTNKSFGIVRIHPLPVVNISASAQAICKGDSVTLAVTGNAVSYTWNPDIIPDQPFAPNATALYEVTGYNDLHCPVTDTLTIALGDCYASIGEENTAQLAIYPNPSNGDFYIEAGQNAQKVIITDLLGKTVYEANTAGQTGAIFVHLNQPAGVYLVTIKTTAAIYCRKIVLR